MIVRVRGIGLLTLLSKPPLRSEVLSFNEPGPEDGDERRRSRDRARFFSANDVSEDSGAMSRCIAVEMAFLRFSRGWRIINLPGTVFSRRLDSGIL